MPNGLGPLAILLVPLAGPPVEIGNEIWLFIEQARPQDIGKEVVIAIPLTAGVERDHEQIRPLEGLERRSSATLPGDRVAQGTVQSVQDAGLEQEPASVVG